MSYPTVHICDETMRDGMQIESVDIPTSAKIELINRIAKTGIEEIRAGSFVSEKYTPQMAHIEEIVAGIVPVEGVRFTPAALNAKGRERAAALTPPLSRSRQSARPSLTVALCETFSKRNQNTTPAEDVARWPAQVARAVESGAKEAGLHLQAAFGSNFEGDFSDDDRMEVLEAEAAAWDAVGIPVTSIQLADPMSWAMPHRVKPFIAMVRDRWPSITHYTFHLHNGRGVALTSIFAILEVLDDRHDVWIDASLGGIGGCPFGGSGQATSMIPTEDLVVMLHEMGIPTGIDIKELIRCVWFLEEILGRQTLGHVSKNGWLPRGDELWDPNLPAVETFREATHFLNGDSVLGDRRPWREPIPDRRGKPRNKVV